MYCAACAASDARCSGRWQPCACDAPRGALPRAFLPNSVLQAAAFARIAGPCDILAAAERGDASLVFCHLIVCGPSVAKTIRPGHKGAFGIIYDSKYAAGHRSPAHSVVCLFFFVERCCAR